MSTLARPGWMAKLSEQAPSSKKPKAGEKGSGAPRGSAKGGTKKTKFGRAGHRPRQVGAERRGGAAGAHRRGVRH
eukprot:8273135-Pyramimonas_sp.AAC.1